MWFDKFVGAVTNINPLARKNYTSCVCLVITDEKDMISSVQETGWSVANELLGQSILWGFKNKWGDERPFLTCMYGGNEEASYQSAMEILAMDCLGKWPLIVLVGHTSPGSETIQTVERGASYEVDKVAKAAKRFITDCAAVTVYLSSCDSGSDGDGRESFQKRFDQYLALTTLEEFPFFSIGTLSGTTPIPLLGVVAASGLRFTYRGVELDAGAEKAEYEALSKKIHE
jgi:hypothetical protein